MTSEPREAAPVVVEPLEPAAGDGKVAVGPDADPDANPDANPDAAPDAAPAAAPDVVAPPDPGLTQAFIAVVVAGAVLTFGAKASAVGLLIAVAVAQAALAVAWVFGTAMPGRRGALVIAGLASVAADIAVSVRPHGQLGVLLPVLGLAVPAIFVHQLTRGAARVQVVASMGAVAMLAIADVALAALLQTRHEFRPADTGGTVAAAMAACVAAALAVGFVADQVVAAPRFDADVPRGLLALVLSAVAGGAVGVLLLRHASRFDAGRGAFAGAALGVLAGLLSVGCSFVLHTTPVPASAWAARIRPVISALLPVALLAPLGFLLLLAIRS